MDEDVKEVLGAIPKYCLIMTPAQQHAYDQGVLVTQWQQFVYPDVHGQQRNPVTPTSPTNTIKNTFIGLLNHTININNYNY